MKKILPVLFLAVFVFFSATFADAQQYTGRRAFSMGGEFIVHVPFPFTVPWGNCGNNLRTFEYVPSYTFSGPAYWDEVFPGEVVSSGNYYFIVDNSQCNPDFVLEGPVFDGDVFGKWFGYDQKFEDIYILFKNADTNIKYSELSPTDTFVLVSPSYGKKYTLDELAEDASSGNFGIQPGGKKLVGAIITDSRGFLKQIFYNPLDPAKSGRRLLKKNNIVINDDQIVVLIYEENY